MKKLLDMFKFSGATSKPNSNAAIAKERLSLVIAHSKSEGQAGLLSAEKLAEMQKEIFAVVAKYVDISAENLTINQQVQDGVECLELSVAINSKLVEEPVIRAACAA